MGHHSTQNHEIGRRLFNSLRKSGPLGTAKSACSVLQNRFGETPGFRRFFSTIERFLSSIQHYLDSSFDRKYGTDTAGVIFLSKLRIESKNVRDGTYYEPMSTRAFKQIMNQLNINFSEFEFIDFGSGKGRALLMASHYGFRKVTGVEFAQDLHLISSRNVAIYKRHIKEPRNIVTICADVVDFPLPKVPVVLFFYSPFRGKVMEKVLNNVSASFSINPRKILLLFYGYNPHTIELFKALKFHCRELKLHADWSRFIQYRIFIFTSQEKRSS